MYGESWELRRVQRTGGTFFITLPKDWARRWGIKKGSQIAMRMREDGCLILDPSPAYRRDLRRVLVNHHGGNINYIDWGVTGAYLLGYDDICIKFPRSIGPRERVRIRGVIRRLIGLEIIEESSNIIRTQCLLDPSTLPPERMLRRMSLITLSMLRDSFTALREGKPNLAEVVISRDDEVDRLYFLLIRVIRSAIQSPKLAEELAVTPIECLDYRVVAALIETAADYISEMAGETLNLIPLPPHRTLLKRLREIEETLSGMQLSSIEGFLTRRLKALEETRRGYQSLLNTLSSIKRGLKDVEKFPSLLPLLSLLDKIGRCYVDVADLIMPREILIDVEAQGVKTPRSSL